jgi:hypothetical protein
MIVQMAAPAAMHEAVTIRPMMTGLGRKEASGLAAVSRVGVGASVVVTRTTELDLMEREAV